MQGQGKSDAGRLSRGWRCSKGSGHVGPCGPR